LLAALAPILLLALSLSLSLSENLIQVNTYPVFTQPDQAEIRLGAEWLFLELL
jgi:hypothetical protein